MDGVLVPDHVISGISPALGTVQSTLVVGGSARPSLHFGRIFDPPRPTDPSPPICEMASDAGIREGAWAQELHTQMQPRGSSGACLVQAKVELNRNAFKEQFGRFEDAEVDTFWLRTSQDGKHLASSSTGPTAQSIGSHYRAAGCQGLSPSLPDEMGERQIATDQRAVVLGGCHEMLGRNDRIGRTQAALDSQSDQPFDRAKPVMPLRK